MTESADLCRLGVLAFGDSNPNAGGELQWGVALQSWAHWTARGLGLPFTNYAVDGNRVTHVVNQQIPTFLERSARPDARYELGCLYIGVNDVRALDWNAEGFASDFRRALGFLQQRCDRLLTVTAPLDLGRPRAVERVDELNVLVEAAARETDALVLDLRNFRGRDLVMADHVHPTAFGQIAIAERALRVLASNGMSVRAVPSQMVMYEVTPVNRLRAEVTYGYRHAKVSLRALALSARATVRDRARRGPPAPLRQRLAPHTASNALTTLGSNCDRGGAAQAR